MSGESSKGRTQSESLANNGLPATVANPLSSPLLPLYLRQAIKIYCNGFIDTVNMHLHLQYLESACILTNTQCRGLFGYRKCNQFQTSARCKRWCFFHSHYEVWESIHILTVNSDMLTQCMCIVVFCNKIGPSLTSEISCRNINIVFAVDCW